MTHCKNGILLTNLMEQIDIEYLISYNKKDYDREWRVEKLMYKVESKAEREAEAAWQEIHHP